MRKAKFVVVAEHSNLKPVKTLVSNSLVHLELLENKEGNLFLCSLIEPEGYVYYATTPSFFCKFLEGFISLQTLFDVSPSHFVEIINKEKAALYNRNDIVVLLKSGNKTIGDLTDSCPIDVW